MSPLPSPSLYPSLTVYPGLPPEEPGGKFVLANVYIGIDGLDVSGFTRHIDIELSRDEIDVTPLGATYREFMPGLEQATFKFDMATGHWTSHQMLRDAYRTTSPVSVEVRPVNEPASTTNPAYTADCLVARFVPLTGAVGELSAARVELRSVGGVLFVTEPPESTALLPSSDLYPSGALLPSA